MSLAEAKDRLRAAADNLSPVNWVRRKPIEAVLAALAAGVIAGVSTRSRKEIIEAVVRILETTGAASPPPRESEEPAEATASGDSHA